MDKKDIYIKGNEHIEEQLEIQKKFNSIYETKTETIESITFKEILKTIKEIEEYVHKIENENIQKTRKIYGLKSTISNKAKTLEKLQGYYR